MTATPTTDQTPSPAPGLHKGEAVKVTGGPFANFSGIIEEVDLSNKTLKVLVAAFGRHIPVTLSFSQVEII